MSCPLYDSPKRANYCQLLPTPTNYCQNCCQLLPTRTSYCQNYCQLLPTVFQNSCHLLPTRTNDFKTIANFDQLLPKHLPTIANSFQLLPTSISYNQRTPAHPFRGVVFGRTVFDTSGLPAILLESFLSIERFRQRKWKHPHTQSAIGPPAARLPNQRPGLSNRPMKGYKPDRPPTTPATTHGRTNLRLLVRLLARHAALQVFLSQRSVDSLKKSDSTHRRNREEN